MTLSLAGMATALADYGFSIFRLSPGSKKPLPGTRGQDDSTTDVETVLEWWTETPTANIGVHCAPSGLYVIDLDRHAEGADGVESWLALTREHGSTPTKTVQTPTGGYHLYYSAPRGHDLRNTAGKLGRGIDTRGNGYVVAPPSSTPQGVYAPVGEHRAIAPLPAWVVEAVRPPAPRPMTRPLPVNTTPVAGRSTVFQRLDQLRDELASAADGTGNHTAAAVAYKAGQFVGANQVTHDQALSVLSSAVSGWQWRRSSDLNTMVNTIDRQLRNGAANPRPWL